MKSAWKSRTQPLKATTGGLRKYLDTVTVTMNVNVTVKTYERTPHGGLKIFVFVVPKIVLPGTSPAKPSFDMTHTIEWCSVVFGDYILLLVYCQIRVGRNSASQAIFLYDNN